MATLAVCPFKYAALKHLTPTQHLSIGRDRQIDWTRNHNRGPSLLKQLTDPIGDWEAALAVAAEDQFDCERSDQRIANFPKVDGLAHRPGCDLLLCNAGHFIA